MVNARKRNKTLGLVVPSDEERTGYLPKPIEDLIVRLCDAQIAGDESESIRSAAAAAHG